VLLDGKKSYLISSLCLDRLGVRLHSALRCLLCVQCGHAFPPNSMATHLKERHAIVVLEDDSKALLEFAEANSVGAQASDIPLPTNYGPPVELVKEKAGFACGIGELQYVFGAFDHNC
jgi:Orsellinic acid/F9775 biosynthesis cluster protein D